MKIVFLGTGTSVGIPVIGCNCRVCTSPNPQNRRRRAAIYIEAGGTNIVVDTPPDFREQALDCGILRLDAVLLTHSHADHIFGFDDIRRFNTLQGAIIPVYGSPGTIADMRRIFIYVRTEHVEGLYRPEVAFHEVTGAFQVGNISVEPLPVLHGAADALGYKLVANGHSVGYVPDCSEMPESTVERVRGVDLMILDALRHRTHSTHLNVSDSIALLRRINAGQSYIIHMCHELDHEETEKQLSPSVRVSYDGLTLTL